MIKKDRAGGRGYSWQSIVISALVVLFFLGVILAYYSMLYSETRQKIIKNDELSSVTSAEQINKYLSKGTDTLKLVCYTLDSMIRAGKSQDEIHDFLVNQSAAVLNTTSECSTGIYGYINGEYLDGTDWVPDADYVPTERPWYIGAQMLSKTAEMHRMAAGARWHHERYDGAGYPDGLVGNEIRVEARIIAVADAYDAMTSRRSYRDMLPQDKVRSEIENGKGSQFDPIFADVMLRMIDEDKDYTMHA